MDIFHPEIFQMVDSIMDDEDPCLLPIGNSIQGEWTKRDTFVYMDCDEEDYWTSNQLEQVLHSGECVIGQNKFLKNG